MTLIVEQVGFTTVQDLGRVGWAHLGVSPSGAADRTSLQLANRLLGNSSAAATLETTGGLALLAAAETGVVLTGAEC
ncbi:MAG: allophanate hydrolase subunit 2 family protein, partial [Ilumatobacteraceae bacterium]